MLTSLFNQFGKIALRAASVGRIAWLRLRFPGAKISWDCTIQRGCKIQVQAGERLILDGVELGQGVVLWAGKGARLEIRDTYVGYYSVIKAKASVVIQPDCMIAEMVVIRDHNHQFGAPGKSIRAQGFTTAPISIGRNVWLAAKASVLEGVSIGENAVIGAHALVNSDVAANTVVVGIPAKQVKEF